MNIFSIVILFFLISAIARAVKTRSEHVQEGTTYKGAIQNTYSQPYVKPLVTETPAVSYTNRSMTAPERSVRSLVKPLESISKVVKPAVEKMEQKADQSTVDYLAEKAEKEQRSQDLESNNAERLRMTKMNGVRAAERVIEGVSVPLDKRLIHCGYCGADNMVSMHSSDKHTCYFCREVL